jgi:hypothetical protein
MTLSGTLESREPSVKQEFFSMAELAARWRCSRGTVYNRLRRLGAKVLDFSANGKKSKKAVPLFVVLQIEARQTKRFA